MRASPSPNDPPTENHWDWRNVGVAFVLSCGTAAVVVWQNSRLAVLWDLSYILENSWRISLGQVPYRDFPFPYPPATFLVQALLIRLTGRVFFHHIVYCAIVGGAGTVLTWQILLDLLRGRLRSFRLIAFLLAAPLIPLGIYCIFPHPFYDPDCTFVILCCVWLLLRLERTEFPARSAFLAGIVCAVPPFVKQNTGLAFFAATALAATLLLVANARLGRRARGYAGLLSGMATGLAIALVALSVTVGLQNYARWTIQFAAARRLPRPAELFAAYHNPLLLVWLAAALAAGVCLHRGTGSGNRLSALLCATLMSAPFFWAVVYLLIDDDSSERAERLLAVWPFLLIVSLAASGWALMRGATLSRLLPLVLIATIQGAFLSQQLWGSTYSIWPLLMLLLAILLRDAPELAGQSAADSAGEKRVLPAFELIAGIVSLCLVIAGAFYVASHERLNYANVADDDLARSSLPALAGLSMRGPWLPQFEELVRFSERAIPRDQALLMIPGEDLFYFTTGRRPGFPVLMFDRTINPYSTEQILDLSRSRNACWLIVKKQLQLNGEPVEDKEQLMARLRVEFAPFATLSNYEIYRRGSGSCGGPEATSLGKN